MSTMTNPTIEAALDEPGRVRWPGELVRPGDVTYDEARASGTG